MPCIHRKQMENSTPHYIRMASRKRCNSSNSNRSWMHGRKTYTAYTLVNHRSIMNHRKSLGRNGYFLVHQSKGSTIITCFYSTPVTKLVWVNRHMKGRERREGNGGIVTQQTRRWSINKNRKPLIGASKLQSLLPAMDGKGGQ